MIPTSDEIFAMYGVDISCRKDRWLARIPEVHLVGVASSCEAAVQALRTNTETFIRDLVEADVVGQLPKPRRRGGWRLSEWAAGFVKAVEAAKVAEAAKPVESVGAISTVSPLAAKPWWDIRSFVLKFVVALLMIALPLGAVGIVVAHRISNTLIRVETAVNQALPHMKGSFWKRADAGLAKFATPEGALPPEKQAELLRELRIAVQRVRPFTDELAPLFTGKPPPSNCR